MKSIYKEGKINYIYCNKYHCAEYEVFLKNGDFFNFRLSFFDDSIRKLRNNIKKYFKKTKSPLFDDSNYDCFKIKENRDYLIGYYDNGDTELRVKIL